MKIVRDCTKSATGFGLVNKLFPIGQEYQGNCIYGRLFDLFVRYYTHTYRHQQIPYWASKRGSSFAGNIVETYKMIAEQVIAFDSNQAKDGPILNCIEAAKSHLESVGLSVDLPGNHSAVYMSRMDGTYFTGCTVWFLDIQLAKKVGARMLSVIQALLPTADAGRPGSSSDPPPVFQ